MSAQLPALDPRSVAPHTGSGYPEPYRSRYLALDAAAAKP